MPNFIAVKDFDNHIFGGFSNTAWEYKSGFFGNGQCFLYTFLKNKSLHVYNSTGQNNYFMYCNKDGIAMGAGNKYGLFIN